MASPLINSPPKVWTTDRHCEVFFFHTCTHAHTCTHTHTHTHTRTHSHTHRSSPSPPTNQKPCTTWLGSSPIRQLRTVPRESQECILLVSLCVCAHAWSFTGVRGGGSWNEVRMVYIFISLTMYFRSTLFTLAKQSKQLGAYKLARHAFDRLQVLLYWLFEYEQSMNHIFLLSLLLDWHLVHFSSPSLLEFLPSYKRRWT